MGEGTITQRNDQAKDKKTRCHFEIRRITRGLFLYQERWRGSLLQILCRRTLVLCLTLYHYQEISNGDKVYQWYI